MTEPHDDHSSTRPISVAELLAKNGTIETKGTSGEILLGSALGGTAGAIIAGPAGIAPGAAAGGVAGAEGKIPKGKAFLKAVDDIGKAITKEVKDVFGADIGPGGAGGGAAGPGGDRGLIGAVDAAITASFGPVAVMPSVGALTNGLTVDQTGLGPPDRKRIAGLLTALFRDPCLCLEGTITTEMKPTKRLPDFLRNPKIVGNAITNIFGSALGGAEIRFFPAPEVGIVPPGGGIPRFSPIPSLAAAINQGFIIASVPEAGAGGGGGGGGGGDEDLVTDEAPYDTYQIEMETNFDTGLVQMPGTGSGASGGISALVKCHGGLMTATMSWVAGRTGAPPILPPFISDNSNVVPLEGTIVAKDMVPSVDGSAVTYLMAGYYVFAVLDPSQYEIVPGVAPFFSGTVRDAAKLAAKYWEKDGMKFVAKGTSTGTSGSNPFVAGETVQGLPPAYPAGFDNAVAQNGTQGTTTPQGQVSQNSLYYSPPIRP